jgi:hypothetical protein
MACCGRSKSGKSKKRSKSIYVNPSDEDDEEEGPFLSPTGGGGLLDPNQNRNQSEEAAWKVIACFAILYLLVGIFTLVYTFLAKNIRIHLTTAAWIRLPTAENATDVGEMEYFYIDPPIPLGAPVGISLCVSGVAKLVRAAVYHYHLRYRIFTLPMFLLAVVDDYLLFAATYVDLALLSGLTDAAHMFFILGILAFSSVFLILCELNNDVLLNVKNTYDGRVSCCNVWCSSWNNAVTHLELYLVPLFACFASTLAPLVATAAYYANSNAKSELITAIYVVVGIAVVYWRVMDVVRHFKYANGTLLDSCFVWADTGLEFISAVVVGLMILFGFTVI